MTQHIRQNYRLKLSKRQEHTMINWLGQGRFVFNHMLALNIEQYAADQTFIFNHDMQKLLPEMKKDPETAWLREIPSQCLQMKCQDLDRALKQSFKSAGKNRKGFPKFKKRDSDTSGINFPKVRVDGNKLILPKMKNSIRMIMDRPLLGEIGSATIYRDTIGHYYVSFVVKIEPGTYIANPVEVIKNAVGIDLGLKEFAITSDGELIENPKFYRKAEKKLRRLQRKVSKKAKGGKNRAKARRILARHHKKIANRRKDFINQVASTIAKENDLICIESLNVKGMVRNNKLSKSISDVGWGMFTTALKWQAKKRGKHVHEVGTFFPSSKTCSNCGSIKTDLTLSDRVYKCGACDYEIDRDINAAINILNDGLKQYTVGITEI